MTQAYSDIAQIMRHANRNSSETERYMYTGTCKYRIFNVIARYTHTVYMTVQCSLGDKQLD